MKPEICLVSEASYVNDLPKYIKIERDASILEISEIKNSFQPRPKTYLFFPQMKVLNILYNFDVVPSSINIFYSQSHSVDFLETSLRLTH